MSHDQPSGQAWNPAEGQPPPGQHSAPGQYGQAPGQYGQAPGQYGVPPSPYGMAPSTYRAWAITCIVCGILFNVPVGLPCGVAALRNSRRVQSAWAAGDQQGAVKASKRAMTWAIVATVVDVIGLIFFINLVSHGSTATS
jgi:hypothetical protein